MALVVADRVQETSITSGTGTLTLTGAVAGYQTFSTAIGNGNTTFYTIYDPTVYDWEVGIGTVGAGTLARTTVLSNSAGTTSPISFASNAKFVFCTYPAEKSINYDANGVATIGEVLGYADTGIVGSFASTVAGYNQVVVQNKSTATNASSNFNVSNDAGTAGSNYAELGINSSTFTGTGSFNIAGASYVASASTDLTLGTYGAYSIHFVTNSNTTDAMTIYNNGGVSLGTFGNPGINNIAASKFVPGYTGVTSAAGTTVLTADSNYYQNLLGSTTQTFQLPDATTLLVGTTFIFDNNSSGTLTVVDNASGPIETIAGGAASFVYLYNNSTVAGSWNKHSFLPASYDFNATTANFGTATITNALWNGTTIATGYGGTGLTSFAAANNALYSTSSSALAAGTLPVAAGGTAATTFTANGVIYGNGTSALGVTAAGTTGQVLLANTSGAPTWGSVPSTGAVTSFQTSLSGLTPSTATTGAVTLAGTLGVTSGGTGTATAFTAGSVVFAGTSGTYSQDNANFFWDDTNNRLGIGTAAPATRITINNNTVLPSAGAITGTNLWQVGADTTVNAALFDSFAGANQILVRRSQGTSASPTALTANLSMVQLEGYGYGATGYSSASRIGFRLRAAENWTDTAQGTEFGFFTTTSGTTTTSEKMRIDNAGNVGIGTTAPTTKLTLSANTALPSAGAITGTNLWQVGADTTNNDILLDAFGGINRINFRRASGTSAAPTALASGNNMAIINGFGYGATGYSSAGRVGINFQASEAWTDTAQGTQILFSTTTNGAAASAERMRIDNAGNVGIGTSSPGAKLTIAGEVSAGQIAGRYFGFGTTGFSFDSTTVNYYGITYTQPTSPSTTYNTVLSAFDNIKFTTAATERMRIDNSGNVGIGTSSPTSKLQVAGSGFFTSRSVPTTGVGIEIYSDGSTYGQLTSYNRTSSTYIASLYDASYHAWQISGAEKMRIDTSGNVGIGTSSPDAKLEVTVGDNGGINIEQSGASQTGYLTFRDSDGGLDGRVSYDHATNAMRFTTATTERMRIFSSGGVSIGNTTDPGAGNLTVTGKISDSKGDVRAAPINSKTSAYVLVAGDAGQTISITTGGVTVNASVLSAGDMVSIFNNSGSSQTITQGASVTLRLSGTASTGNRTLAQYGVATLLCIVGGATPTFACTGAGLS